MSSNGDADGKEIINQIESTHCNTSTQSLTPSSSSSPFFSSSSTLLQQLSTEGKLTYAISLPVFSCLLFLLLKHTKPSAFLDKYYRGRLVKERKKLSAISTLNLLSKHWKKLTAKAVTKLFFTFQEKVETLWKQDPERLSVWNDFPRIARHIKVLDSNLNSLDSKSLLLTDLQAPESTNFFFFFFLLFFFADVDECRIGWNGCVDEGIVESVGI
jgi:hypothetical protein